MCFDAVSSVFVPQYIVLTPVPKSIILMVRALELSYNMDGVLASTVFSVILTLEVRYRDTLLKLMRYHFLSVFLLKTLCDGNIFAEYSISISLIVSIFV